MPSTTRALFAAIAVALALTACSESPTTSDRALSTAPAWSIQDGASGGTAHFYFLPPLVPAPTYSGVFDPTQRPVVSICAWAAGACQGASVAEFSTESGSGSTLVRVDTADEQYIVNWHTPSDLDPAATYRVRVLVQGLEVGHADVRAGERAADLKGLDRSQFVGLVAGSTLPIKFRIEVGLITCQPQLGVSGNNLLLNLGAGVIPFDPTVGNAGIFKGTPVLFSGGLVYGTDSTDVVVGYNTASGASDFDTTVPICVARTPDVTLSRAELVVVNPAGPPVSVVQESFALQQAPDDDYVVLRYTFTNTSNAPIAGLRVGLVFDWDVYFSGAARDFNNDVVRYLPPVDAGFIGEQDTNLGGAGFASIDPLASYAGYFNGQFGPREAAHPFYWTQLAGPINTAPVGPRDVRQLGGVAPIDLAPGASHTFVFIVSGGDNITDFAANVLRARQVIPGL